MCMQDHRQAKECVHGKDIVMYQIDFDKPEHIHFIGIGGISMSGLAEILLDAVSYTHLPQGRVAKPGRDKR